jgi:hypothetical protein
VEQHGSRLFDVLFRRKSNGLVDYQEVIEAKVTLQEVKVRAKEMETIVFLVIEARTKEKAKKQCKEKNNKSWKEKIFKIRKVIMKKKNRLVARIQTL